MSKQGKNALSRKIKMQERIKEMESQVKELEERAQLEIGKTILKEWDIKDDYDVKLVFDVIRTLKADAIELLKDKEEDMGKSEL